MNGSGNGNGNGAALPALAFAYASRFPLGQAGQWFAGSPELRRFKTHIVAGWSEHEVAFAYDFGALVFINVPKELQRATSDAFSRALPNEPHPPLREDFSIEVRRGGRVEVGFDRVRVPQLTPAVFEVVATVIAQSVSLDYYDEDVQATLDRIHAIASRIAQDGRPPRTQGEIVRFVGASIASQIEIISSLSLLDKPDLTWDDALADDLHDKLRYAFEISERYRALEAKITTSRQAFSAFLEMMHSRRSLLLESTVVALIFVEIVLSLLKLH
jgi:required for meiotic nuclear division protein 1